MIKILSTIFLTFMILSSFCFSDIVEARGFICMVCGEGIDVRIGDLAQNSSLCKDGYNHYLSPTGSTFLNVVPKDFFECTVKTIQGTWVDNEGNTISINGIYLNRCLMRSMVKTMKGQDLKHYGYVLVIEEEKTSSGELEWNTESLNPYIIFRGVKYLKL